MKCWIGLLLPFAVIHRYSLRAVKLILTRHITNFHNSYGVSYESNHWYSLQARKQDVFLELGHFEKQSCATQERRPGGKNLRFFLLEILCILNEKFNPYMTTLRAFFPKLGHIFQILEKELRRPPLSFKKKDFLKFSLHKNIPWLASRITPNSLKVVEVSRRTW